MRHLLLYQVYGAIWMLACEVTTYLRGGFLADDVGYGKTLMTILTVLTLRWIEITIQRAWIRKDSPIEYPTWRASPAALARLFEDYVRQLDRWIEEILSEDDPAAPARPGDNAENPLVVPEVDDEAATS
ncbi:hypothetical protein AtubIFM57258_003642 [Aspergillus tubingensis]|nr:hypothetical protein AtubIFM57258_003642 [Aspergillus tubingensis]